MSFRSLFGLILTTPDLVIWSFSNLINFPIFEDADSKWLKNWEYLQRGVEFWSKIKIPWIFETKWFFFRNKAKKFDKIWYGIFKQFLNSLTKNWNWNSKKYFHELEILLDARKIFENNHFAETPGKVRSVSQLKCTLNSLPFLFTRFCDWVKYAEKI